MNLMITQNPKPIIDQKKVIYTLTHAEKPGMTLQKAINYKGGERKRELQKQPEDVNKTPISIYAVIITLNVIGLNVYFKRHRMEIGF